MAPPNLHQQQVRSKPNHLNESPTFVTEQALNATLKDLVQEMKNEFNSIRNDFRNDCHSAAAIARTQ